MKSTAAHRRFTGRSLVLFFIFAVLLSSCQTTRTSLKTNADLYAAAVADAAKQAEQKDVFPLAEITKDSTDVTWNADGTKVLIVSWHHYPDSYAQGKTYTKGGWELWGVSLKEFKNWYRQNNKGVADWNLRFKQLMGLPESKNHTHFSAMWISPDCLLRPAYETSVAKQMSTSFSADFLSTEYGKKYKQWFNSNAEYSYGSDNPYPWTRLGYTYDWADNKTKKGLTEFFIPKDAPAEYTVEFTTTTEEFLRILESSDY
ncbi:MAG: hypothetical protein KBS64_07155 [Treponema sp.]|nr:hypothetical protein [Candidatus Treponema equi]